MVALGVANDEPPTRLQPELDDGVHLRWSTRRELGFPWFGFYLFRRPHRETERECIGREIELDQDVHFSYDEESVARAVEVTVRLTQWRDPGKSEDTRPKIRVRALYGTTVVGEATLTGEPGDLVRAELRADSITEVQLRAGGGSLVDLCAERLGPGAHRGWGLIEGAEKPIGLPVLHPDYPATGNRPIHLGKAEAIGLDRVRYGSPDEWEGDPFKQLHEQLLALVDGGPGTTAMDERVLPPIAGSSASVAEAPTLRGARPLDLVMVGALHRALAEVVGLSFTDRSADPGERYDYLVVADHTGVGKLNTDVVLSEIANNGFDRLDGWIVFDRTTEPAEPLAAPSGVRSFALPGLTMMTAEDDLLDATGAVGLRWPTAPAGLSTRPVLFHVWRGDAGNGGEPEAPSAPAPITERRPVMPIDPPGSVERPPDWPPLNMHFVERGLEEGWYRYAISGIDVFGRHSAPGDAAQWWQWAPQPKPVPWYYRQPAANRVVHPDAIRVLDKVGPPPPSGVEAWALDPADPYLQRDGAHGAWWASLSPAEREETIGLRIRWQWTIAQRRQAPDASEFRIYYAAGTNPPAGREDPTAWDARLLVVGFNEHVTVGTDAHGQMLRRYEVFLPVAGAAVRDGLPLSPSLADPIAYAHVAVSAADKRPHTADDSKWDGTPFGGRHGNEGPVGMAVKVFRVHRTPPPPPPVPPPDGERVFATAADYHGDSYFTYRWAPRQHLKTHVLRAVDEAVFEADRAHHAQWRPLSPNDRAAFPDPAAEPRWDALKRQQIAAELNGLHDPTGPAAALSVYRRLSNDGLRVLAGLPGADAAFMQLTIAPLDPGDPANANRAGPDNPAGFHVDPGLRAYLDRLPGAATNRYLYRAAYVDPAHNRSGLSQATAPVWLPNVVPPRAPGAPRALAGERRIVLRWPSNREPDLAEYRVYRADDDRAARDVRTMKLVQTVAVPAGDPDARPAAVEWTDTPLPGLVGFRYRIVAVDTAGNASEPTAAVVGRAFDESLPEVPPLTLSWQGSGADRRARLEWTSPDESLIQRRPAGSGQWIDLVRWRAAGTHSVTDRFSRPDVDQQYRVWTRKATGAVARGEPSTLAAP